MEQKTYIKTVNPTESVDNDDEKNEIINDVLNDPEVNKQTNGLGLYVKIVSAIAIITVMFITIIYILQLRKKVKNTKEEMSKSKTLIQKRDRELNNSINYIADLKQELHRINNTNRANIAINNAVEKELESQQSDDQPEVTIEKPKILTRQQAKRLQQTIKEGSRNTESEFSLNDNIGSKPSHKIIESQSINPNLLNIDRSVSNNEIISSDTFEQGELKP